MKKFIALLTVAAASLTPMASLQAQTTENNDIWTALSKTASLENANTLESVYGSFELEDAFKVDYRFNINHSLSNTEKMASSSKIDGSITVTSQNTDASYPPPFKSLNVAVNGEVISANDEDIYLKLNDFAVNTDTEDADLEQEINDAMVVVNLVKGNWYHLSLADFYGEELDVMSSKALLESFKKDSKQALKGLIEEMVTEQVKQQQYYDSMIGDYDDWTAAEALETTLLEDYQTYLTAEVKQSPVDLEALVTKGVLECDDDTYLGDGLENGFQYPGCWPAIAYAGQLTTDEKELTEMLYANSGEWIYEDGKWYYAEIYPTQVTSEDSEDEDLSYDDIVSPENFDYDEKAIEGDVTKIMKAVDSLLNEDLFIQHDIISGPNKGYQFYSLKRGTALNVAKNFATSMGETVGATDEAELRKMLGKISLAGIYNIREDNGVIDNLFTGFKFRDESFLKNFELNYRYKLMDWEKVNKIQIPTKVTELEDLEKLMD